MSDRSVRDVFDMSDRVVIITGGAGLLGKRHAAAVARVGAIPVLVDIKKDLVVAAAAQLSAELGCVCLGVHADITDEHSVRSMLDTVLRRYQRVDVLINNAANNPTM